MTPARPQLRVAEREAPPRPPSHLRAATRRWWTETACDYELESHHLLLLTAAAEAWDRMQQAREAVKRDGAYLPDRYGGRKAHPALGIERDSRLAFARLLRELDLDGEPAPDPRVARRRG